MGLKFRKSVKIAPGVKININKKSVSTTFGTKGASHTINSKGKRTTTVGVPGTGLSYSSSTQKKRKPNKFDDDLLISSKSPKIDNSIESGDYDLNPNNNTTPEKGYVIDGDVAIFGNKRMNAKQLRIQSILTLVTSIVSISAGFTALPIGMLLILMGILFFFVSRNYAKARKELIKE